MRIYRCRDHAHLGRAADFCDLVVERTVIARLSQPDARDLLVQTDGPDVDALRREADTLRLRRDSIADLIADGLLSSAKGRATLQDLTSRIGLLEAQTVRADRAPVLGALVGAVDVERAWRELPLTRRRAVVDLLVRVTVLPGRPGRGSLTPDSVRRESKL